MDCGKIDWNAVIIVSVIVVPVFIYAMTKMIMGVRGWLE